MFNLIIRIIIWIAIRIKMIIKTMIGNNLKRKMIWLQKKLWKNQIIRKRMKKMLVREEILK